jgi:pimeloyl-ACP methyl ester carboxylesterase
VSTYDRGSGPPVIVIPGMQGRWEWIRPGLNALASRCRTLSYTLAGDFGSGWKLDPARGFDNYIRQLDDVFARTGLKRAAVCGISYGGAIALRYAACRPERVAALILVSAPAPGWRPNPIQSAYLAQPWRRAPKFVLTSPQRIWPEVLTALGSVPSGLAFLARHGLRVAAAPMIPGLVAARILEQQALDFSGDCAAVRAPTLIVSGEPGLDRIVPVESTRAFREMISGAKHVTIERTGHLGPVTRPSVWANTIADFVCSHGT